MESLCVGCRKDLNRIRNEKKKYTRTPKQATGILNTINISTVNFLIANFIDDFLLSKLEIGANKINKIKL